jgi:hypothetical protein
MKSPFKSKTLWANFLVAAIAFFPKVSDQLDSSQVMLALSFVNVVLRMVTKDKIGLE